MDFRVEITEPAIADLKEIVSYIALHNAPAAATLGNNLLDAALALASAPYKGSSYRRLSGVRKLSVRPFKVFYRIDDENGVIQVLRFWHGARREPKL